METLRRLLGLRPAVKTPGAQTASSQPAGPVSGPTVSSQPAVAVESEVAAGLKDTQPLQTATTKDEAEPSVLSPDLDGRTRQLPPLETVMPSSSDGARLIYGQRSDVGQVRENNQDAMFTFVSSMASSEQRPDFGLFIVADGMGGHEHGEKASAMATRVVAKYVTDDIFMPMLYSDPGGNAERPTVAEVLRNAVQKANEIVSEQVPEGGTTVTAAAIMGNLVYIAHVGDSRAYLITQDGIEQITRDHSLVQRLIELDQLTPEDAIEHPQRNVLYRAIGQSESLDVDAITRQIPPGGYLLLCSDGLWNLVGKEEIQEIVLQHSGSNQAACEALVGLANERGGPDNITVVLVRVPPIPS